MRHLHFVFLLGATVALQAGTVSAAPKDPIFCDEIHVKTCRPPAELGGVYPHCFCSVPAGLPTRSRVTTKTCVNKCNMNEATCRLHVSKMCNPLHHPCDDDGLQAQQEASQACTDTLKDCLSSCSAE